MSEFKSVEDLSIRTPYIDASSPFDSIDAFSSSRGSLRIADDGDCITINTRAAAIALRDWLSAAIGDKP